MDDPRYRYTESGLDNVFIEGLEILEDHAGEETYTIPNVLLLHKVIAHAIITGGQGIAPAELRFLRTEMGMTQAELAKILHLAPLTVGRWERGERPMDGAAELVVRMLAAERLDINPTMSIEELAKGCGWRVETRMIQIDGSDPSNYRAMAA